MRIAATDGDPSVSNKVDFQIKDGMLFTVNIPCRPVGTDRLSTDVFKYTVMSNLFK